MKEKICSCQNTCNECGKSFQKIVVQELDKRIKNLNDDYNDAICGNHQASMQELIYQIDEATEILEIVKNLKP